MVEVQRRRGAQVALLTALTAAMGLIGLAAVSQADSPPSRDPAAAHPVQPLFTDWPANQKPDVALLLSGEQHSYLKFCGCSSPQYGGLERRYNLLQGLKNKGWHVAAFDLGDIILRSTNPPTVPAQTMLKYKTSMRALQLHGYSAVAIGEQEFNLPLLEALSNFTLQQNGADPQVLAANLKDRIEKFPLDEKQSMVGDAVVVPAPMKVGAIAVIAPSVQNRIADKSLKFDDNTKVLNAALKRFDDEKVELRVLLYQGTPEEATKAIQQFPDKFHVVLSKSEEEEPPQRSTMVGRTMLVNVGHRGRYVGVVGGFRRPDGVELHYQLVRLGEEYETEPGKEKEQPIVALLEDYAKEVRDRRLLSTYPRTPSPLQVKFPKEKVKYIGSDQCKKCHAAEYATWSNSKHSHAYDALVKVATKPSLRQYDGECVVCHVQGFSHQGGFVTEKSTPDLKHVGCENCHGPGNLHAQDPSNKKYHPFLSPWKAADKPKERLKGAPLKQNMELLLRIDQFCQKCHDIPNDPTFRFENNWPKIAH